MTLKWHIHTTINEAELTSNCSSQYLMWIKVGTLSSYQHSDGVSRPYCQRIFEEVLIDKQIHCAAHPNTTINNGLCEIQYKGLQNAIGKTLFVGPNKPAYQVGPVQLLMSEISLFCDRCLCGSA